MSKPVFIYNNDGKIKDLSDLVRIARSIGRKLLNSDDINVKPLAYPFQNGFWLEVEKNGDKTKNAKTQ